MVGKEKLGSCLMDEFRMKAQSCLDLREGLGSMDLGSPACILGTS